MSADDPDALTRAALLRRRRRTKDDVVFRTVRRRGSAAALAAEKAYRPSSGTRDGRFVRVTGAHPCPVCGRPDWCRVAREGATVLCQRVPSERVGTDALGDFYVHHIDGREAPAPRPAPLVVVPDRADAETRDRAYRALLDVLSLDRTDRDELARRGFRDADIDRGDYRTLAIEGRARLARVVVDAVGEDAARRVPGIVRREEDGRAWWSLGGAAGLLIPMRNFASKVVALKVRRREASVGPRYTTVSSAPRGGPPGEAALHVPLQARTLLEAAGGVAEAIVVEGELKADLVTALLGVPCVSVPGVGAWRLALEAATHWRPSRLVVAFDMDRQTNFAVARAQKNLVQALAAAEVPAVVARWDARFKGLDDYLAARAKEGVATW